MRAFLATTIGVACTAALALPFAVPTGAAAHSGRSARPAHTTASQLPGSTRTLPLVPLSAPTVTHGTDRAPGAPAEQGLSARQVAPFSLLGVTWDNPAADLDAAVQVRTRAAGTGTWSGWRDVQAHNDDAPDADGRTGRGATAPLWVGASDGVQVRVQPAAGGDRGAGSAAKVVPLPGGLRLEMVDPGDDGPVTPVTPVTPVAPAVPATPATAPSAPVTDPSAPATTPATTPVLDDRGAESAPAPPRSPSFPRSPRRRPRPRRPARPTSAHVPGSSPGPAGVPTRSCVRRASSTPTR